MNARVRPLVRCHDGMLTWACDACHVGGAIIADDRLWGLIHDAARDHYRVVHGPGLQRVLAAVRDLPAERVRREPRRPFPWWPVTLAVGAVLTVAAWVLVLTQPELLAAWYEARPW